MRHHALGEGESEYLMARRWLMPIAKPTSLLVSFILAQKCSVRKSSSSDSAMRKGPFSPRFALCTTHASLSTSAWMPRLLHHLNN
eukprot:1951638-Alexandrium_andersonii.AAC.1